MDFNSDNQLKDNIRLIESLPTINFLLEHGAIVTIMSHKGRPENFAKQYSFKAFS